MKRFSKILALIVLTVTALSMIFACAPTTPSDPTPPPVEKITLNKSVASMDLYETLTLTASKENLTGEVVWTSSDTSKATVNGGVVTSLAEGEVTVTASVGDKSATCTITIVSSGQVPVLTLGSTEETIKAGNTFIVTPTLNYKGNTLNATFAYSVEDSEIVSVLDGVITALKPGSTTITVTATYLGYQTYERISVTVTQNVSFTLSETSLVLGTSEVADYKKSATVNAEIYENGQLLSSPSITWKSADDEIATVNGGVITATGVGEVIISATYTSNGKDFTVNLPVVVEKPTVSVAFDDLIDLNGQSGENASVDLSELFEGTSYTADNVVKITDITGEEAIDIAFTAQNTAVSFKKSAMATGERVIGVELDDITYAVSVTVVTKVITTADELLALESYAPNVKSITWELWGNTGTEESYDGYFVLGANIDLGNREVQNINEHKYLRIWKDAEEGAGFCGIFDGRGYTINGGVYRQGGLFGYLWKTGVIKNVAFTNVTISSEQYSSIIGISVWGTIENVLFHVTKSELPDCEGAFVAGNSSPTFTSNNVILYEYTDMDTTNCGKSSAFINHFSTGKGAYDNTFVFTDGYVGQQRGDANDFADVLTPVSLERKITEVIADGEEWSGVWDLSGNMAIFNSQKEIIENELSSVTEIELTAGKQYAFPEIYGCGFNLSTSVDASVATVNGNLLQISDSVSKKTTFTVTLSWEANETVKKDVTVTVLVTTKHDFTATPVAVELYGAGDTVTVTASGLSESVKSVTVDNNSVNYVGDGENITIDKNILTCGEKTLVVLTESHEYTYKLDVISKTITTKEDFLAFVQQAKFVEGDENTKRTGIIKLGADIDLGGASITPAMGKYVSGWVGGWGGTFDGQDHVISNYIIDGNDGGLFRAMHDTAVFKNVLITGVTVNGSSGAITCANYGLIQNVMVVGAITGANNANIGAGLFAANVAKPQNAKFIDCVGVLTQYAQPDVANAGIICGSIYQDTRMLLKAEYTNVIAINAQSEETLVPYACKHGGRASTQNGAGLYPALDPVSNYQGENVYGNDTESAKTFVSWTEYSTWLSSAEEKWANAIALVKKYLSADVKISGAPSSEINAGESVQLTAGNVTWSIKGDTPTGVAVSESGLVTTTTATPKEITFVVSSASKIDPSVTDEVTIRISSRSAVTQISVDKTDIQTLSTANEIVVEGVSNLGALSAATFEGNDITGVTVSGNKITVDGTKINSTSYGEGKTLIVRTDSSEGSYVVTVNATLVTKIFYTASDLNEWWTIMDFKENDRTTYGNGGYYVIGDDIEYNGTWDAKWVWINKNTPGNVITWNENGGFNGTFDGRGHYISGMTMGAMPGFFGCVNKNSVIKDIAFINASMHTNGGAFITQTGGGTMKNVYVQLNKLEYNAKNDGCGVFWGSASGPSATLINCFVDAKAVADGAKTDITRGIIGWLDANATITDCFAITQGANLVSAGVNVSSVKAYADRASMISASDWQAVFATWDTNFWTTDSDGLPIPKSVVSAN